MGEKITVKPCPCCGAAVIIDCNRSGLFRAASIECVNAECGLRMVKRGMDTTAALKKAVNAWNKRVEV